MTWSEVLIVLGTSGLLAMLGAALKELWGWGTQRNGRKMTEARSALGAMGIAGRWQQAYYAARAWCWGRHGYSADFPGPPDTKPHTPDDDKEA